MILSINLRKYVNENVSIYLCKTLTRSSIREEDLSGVVCDDN